MSYQFLEENSFFKKIEFLTFTAILFVLASCSELPKMGAAGQFDKVKSNHIALRQFIQTMPKGGDLHNHLSGAVYAESWIRWAEEDGLCLDSASLSIRFPGPDGCGELSNTQSALANNQKLRNELIDKLSLRDYVSSAGWSGHDQFFDTFMSMAAMPNRLGDMVADAANLAGRQNIGYLELMNTQALYETILPMVSAIEMTGNPETDYKTLMGSEFGITLPNMVEQAKLAIDQAIVRKDKLLECETDQPQPGCKVEVRFLNQGVRTLPSSAVFAHAIFGWHLMKEDSRVVGTNLVAPEDDYIALRDYKLHMAQLDFLYKTLGERNISLHAGELWLGLVHPKELRFHITEAVMTGHAKRIGHGTAIVFESNYKSLLKYMKEHGIAVEISLTSSDAILGVKGSKHPITVYRNAGIPITLSTDDEGVSRIDLSHEYVRAVQEFDLSYADLKELSYNGLKYAFLPDNEKAAMIKSLDERFLAFENRY